MALSGVWAELPGLGNTGGGRGRGDAMGKMGDAMDKTGEAAELCSSPADEAKTGLSSSAGGEAGGVG